MDSISYTEATSFTPIYRHGNSDILPARAQREAALAEQPWTATRCHRQLRPLLAHLTALRRERAAAELKRKNDDSRFLCSTKKRLPCDSDAADRKRLRYTYSQKGMGRRRKIQPSTPSTLDTPDRPTTTKEPAHVTAKQQSKRSFSPGEIVLATPMISRARKRHHAQGLQSSPLASMTEATPTAEEQPRGLSASKPKTAKSMPEFGYYRRTARLGGNAATKTPADEDWAILSKETPAENHALHEAIFRTVATILRATVDSTRETSSKPSSLLAMCLRKVPQFISMCEDAERQGPEEKEAGTSNVSMDIYNDLESMGRVGGGWKHLRTVVREHALNILKEACAEGLFHFAFVRLLARLCVDTRAYTEGEALMAVLFDMHAQSAIVGQRLFPQPTDVSSCLPDSVGACTSLNLVIKYSHESGRTSAALRIITSLLKSGQLPLSWLSTPALTTVWHRVARLLSSRGPTACDEARLADFVVSALSAFVTSRPEDDIQPPSLHASPRNNDSAPPLSSSSSYHAIVSILGTMCAISILQQETISEGSDLKYREPEVAKRLANIFYGCLSEAAIKPRGRKGRLAVADAACIFPRRFLLELALCVLDVGMDRDGDDRLQNFVQADDVVKGQLYDTTVAFATSVAENCGRGSKSAAWSAPDVRDYLRNICQHLSKRVSGVVKCESSEDLSRRLLADSAFLLASRSNDLRDLAFAESLGKSMSVHGEARVTPAPAPLRPMETPLAKTTGATTGATKLPGLFEGYRWEEGISEWVISTPISAGRSVDAMYVPISADSTRLGAFTPRDGEAGAVAGLKPDLLRTPMPYLTPSPSMRASLNIGAFGSIFDDPGEESEHAEEEYSDSDHSDAGDDAAPSPELPSRRVSAVVGRPSKTTRQSLPSSDFCPYSSDSDWAAGTRRQCAKRAKRASLPCPKQSMRPPPRPRPRQSLSILDLVSDDVMDDEFGGSPRTDKSVKSVKSITTARAPLLSLANTRRSSGAGRIGKGGAKTAMPAASSDDELGL